MGRTRDSPFRAYSFGIISFSFINFPPMLLLPGMLHGHYAWRDSGVPTFIKELPTTGKPRRPRRQYGSREKSCKYAPGVRRYSGLNDGTKSIRFRFLEPVNITLFGEKDHCRCD